MPGVAVNKPHAYGQRGTAESGKHIDSTHADHLAEHAQNVIVALGG